MENLPRPAPSTLRARVAEWVTWFGPARLATSAAAVVLVCAGAYWLTRAPRPPTEAALPTTTAGLVADATLAPPAGDDAGPDEPARVTVHVTGAVVAPGVYELEAGARVQAAIDLAGGATVDGDPDAINLAAVAVDGARIYVPAVGEEIPVASVDAAVPAGPVVPIDVNRASITELEQLPGVGPATATAIVTERERNGPFPNVDDLQRVPGIGPARLEMLRDLVTT